MRGTERVHQEFPLRFQMLLIVTRMGRGLLARSAPADRAGRPQGQRSDYCLHPVRSVL